LLASKRRSGGDGSDKKQAVSLSIKEGGDQIEYEDQDPSIHPLWLKEMAIHGGTPKMQKYFPDSPALADRGRTAAE
jgi:hypothetical protein